MLRTYLVYNTSAGFFVTTGKKRSSRLSVGCAIIITTGIKKNSSRLSGRCAIVITTRKKSSSRLSGECAIVITTGKKKFLSSVWQVRDCYYDRKKKNLVVCLAGCAVVSVFGPGGK